jgi:hypothetical protein
VPHILTLNAAHAPFAITSTCSAVAQANCLTCDLLCSNSPARRRPGMSAIGTKRTWDGALQMSAIGCKADIAMWVVMSANNP